MAVREQLILEELDVNDGTTFELESLKFTPAQAKPQWATSADSDGDVLVDEPHFTNAYFEAQVRILPAADTDTALEAFGELVDKLQGCARTENGSALEWTPNRATGTLTWYATLGELPELPTEMTGDLAGWFLDQPSPVVKVKLTCRPFGHREARLVLESTESEDPMQVANISGVLGDVPAEARLRITDAAAKNRHYAEVGQDILSEESDNSTSRVKADDMTSTGYLGSLTTRSGSYSTKALKATLSNDAAIIGAITDLGNVGGQRLKLRVEVDDVSYFRIAYSDGDGPLTTLPWVEVPGTGDWFELDMRELFSARAVQGEQVTRVFIEGKSEEEATSYVDVLYLVPSRRYTVVRGPASSSEPTFLSGQDDFNQSSGALSGKTAETGGTWSGAGDANDFEVV